MPTTATAPLLFPGHVIALDSQDEPDVLAIQHRLNELGVNVDVNGEFDRATAEAVKLFQARSTDLDGTPLEVDGIVGPLTWAALFGPESVSGLIRPSSPLLVKPGHIFVIRTSAIHGHSGFIERVNGGKLVTIEGNTNEGGGREGIGVFRRTARKIVSINKGFIDYNGV